MKNYTRVYARINLDHVIFNIQSIKRHLTPGTGILAVVKADGYGHGAVPVALALAPYVAGYAVATIEEALILRHHGIIKPVLILGVTHESRYEDLLQEDITATVFTMEQALPLSGLAVCRGQKARVHLALDTGMSRIGLSADITGANLAAAICGLPGLAVEGIFTHFAKADETDKSGARQQIVLYENFLNLLKQQGIKIPVKHCSNSAGAIDLPPADYDLVRPGISIYGLYPSDEMVNRQAVPLKPVMELKSVVTYVKTISAGREVSYGGTFRAGRETVVATVPVGYGDGYPRNLSGKGHVLIHGRKAPVLGRVCMDQMMVDVTGMADVTVDTEVTLIGRDGEAEIRVEDLAAIGGGFHYEIICDISKRIPRVYVMENKVIGCKDYFDDIYHGFESMERITESSFES